MFKKVITICLIVAAFIAVLWMGNVNKARLKDKIYEVSAEPVSITGTVETNIETAGQIKIKEEKLSYAMLSFDATVVRVFVEDRQAVEIGEALIAVKRYSDEEYKLKLEEADKELETINYQLETLAPDRNYYEQTLAVIGEKLATIEAEKKYREKTYDSKKVLWENGIISASDFENSEIEYKKAICDLEQQFLAANEEKKEAEKKYKDSLNNYQKLLEDRGNKLEELQKLKEEQLYVIKAEAAGNVIFSKSLFEGLVLNCNEPVMKVVDISKSDIFYAETQLTDSEYNNISVKDKVNIRLNGIQNNTLEGTISDFLPVVQEKDGYIYYTVRIDLKPDAEKVALKPDMPVEINIQSILDPNKVKSGGANKEYFILPVSAVVFRNNKNAVLVYSKTEKADSYFAKLIYVDVLASNADKVIVSSDSLNKDSLIITLGNYNLYGGEKVTLNQESQGGTLDLNLFN